MTQRTRGFVRTAKGLMLLALGFTAGATAHRAITPIEPDDVHISGDGVAQLAEVLFTWPGPSRARDPDFAATQVITVRRWQNLEGLTEVARLCGAACDGRAAVVTIRRPALNGSSQVILINLGDHGAGEALDRGEPIPDNIADCVVQAIEVARADNGWNVSTCDIQEGVTVMRPRFWTPERPSPGILGGL